MKRDLWTLLKMCESPAEKDFLCAAYEYIDGLIPQYVVPGYRLDFAIPDKRIAIEIDGHDYHKTKEQRTHDAKRERELELTDWKVIRFTASEIYQNAPGCVNDVLHLMQKYEIVKTRDENIEAKFQKASSRNEKARLLDPICNRSLALIEGGMIDEAKSVFDKAIQMNESEAYSFLIRRGLDLYHAKKHDEAITFLEKFIDMYPQFNNSLKDRIKSPQTSDACSSCSHPINSVWRLIANMWKERHLIS